MGRHPIAMLTGLGLVFAMLAGCSTSPEPGITAKLNRLETQVNADPKRVTEATNAVLNEMDLFVISSTATQLDGRVIARSGTDRRLTVDVRNMGQDRSQVALKGAGDIFRDSGLGVSILNRIRQRAEGAGAGGETPMEPAPDAGEGAEPGAEPGAGAETS
jgi:hypothetical protein